jgi:hypothetical protein
MFWPVPRADQLTTSDQEGRKQRARYEEVFGVLVHGRVVCLEDVDASWSQHGMEALFELEDRLAIQKAAYPEEDSYKKVLFNRAIQELLATGRTVTLNPVTLTRFRTLLDGLRARLQQNSPEDGL